MIHKPVNKMRHKIKGIVHRVGLRGRRHRSAIRQFAEKIGLVYFGSINQHQDDYGIIRGITASSSHRDDHYCVGTFDGYDIRIVDRIDSSESPTGKLTPRHWIIFEIQLTTPQNMPRIILLPRSHDGSLSSHVFTDLSSLQDVPLGTFGKYHDEFTRRYHLYATATHFIDAQLIFSHKLAQPIAAHFWPQAVELYDSRLYIYSDDTLVTAHLLGTMLQNGMWLAKTIDAGAMAK